MLNGVTVIFRHIGIEKWRFIFHTDYCCTESFKFFSACQSLGIQYTGLMLQCVALKNKMSGNYPIFDVVQRNCILLHKGVSDAGTRRSRSTVPANIFELERHSGKYCLSQAER